MRFRVMITGNYDMTRALAVSLLKKKYKVTAIHSNYRECEQLAEIDGLMVIHGDSTKPYILEEAGTRDVDIVIAMMEKDDDNLVICELCKKKFHVSRTLCTIKNAENTSFFRKMGVDAVICATNTITNMIEQQAFIEDMATLIPIGEGRLSIAEISVREEAPVVGKKLWELKLPEEAIIGCILREEKTVIPRGDTRLLSGDRLIVLSSSKEDIKTIQELTGR